MIGDVDYECDEWFLQLSNEWNIFRFVVIGIQIDILSLGIFKDLLLLFLMVVGTFCDEIKTQNCSSNVGLGFISSESEELY